MNTLSIGWNPIETAPMNEDVLLHSPDADVEVVIGHKFHSEPDSDWYPQHETTFDGGPFDVGFTHWMPIPSVA